MSRQLSIAIIEADVPLAGTAQRHGSYGGVFSSVLNQAAHTLIPPVSLSLSYHAISMGGTFPSTSALAQLDGIIITGSRASAFDDTPWIVELVAFVRDVLHHHKKVKVVGVCFGHQIIARALGVQVRRGDGWEASVSNVHMTHAGREIFGRDVLVRYPLRPRPRSYCLRLQLLTASGPRASTKCTATLSPRFPGAP